MKNPNWDDILTLHSLGEKNIETKQKQKQKQKTPTLGVGQRGCPGKALKMFPRGGTPRTHKLKKE
jgi:hypothetical protein